MRLEYYRDTRNCSMKRKTKGKFCLNKNRLQSEWFRLIRGFVHGLNYALLKYGWWLETCSFLGIECENLIFTIEIKAAESPIWIWCPYVRGAFGIILFSIPAQTFDKAPQRWQGLRSAETPEKANYLDCIAEIESSQVMQYYIISPSIFHSPLLSFHCHFNCFINIYITIISK